MKISCFPLLFCDDDFETDLRINYAHDDIVSIDIIREGNKTRSRTVVLNGDTTLDGASIRKGLYDTKFSLRITSSDDTNFIAVVFDRKEKNVVLTITPVLITDLKEVIQVKPDEKKMMSFGSADNDPFTYIKFRGEPGVSYLNKNFYEVLHFIAKYIYYKYPDRKDRRLTLADCTPLEGDPVDSSGRLTHPAGSHSGGKALDTHYFTLDTNYTHFWTRETRKIGTIIWENEDLFPDMILLKNVFDWERNWEFFKLMKEFIPDSFYMINDMLLDHIRNMVRSTYGYEEYTKTFGVIQGDTNKGWNHHLHCHCMLGHNVSVNLEGISASLCIHQNISSFNLGVSTVLSSDNVNNILLYISKYRVDNTVVPDVKPIEPTPVPEPVVITPEPEVVKPYVPEPVVETKPEPVIEPTPVPTPEEPAPKPAPGTSPLVIEPKPVPTPTTKKKTASILQNILKWIQEHLF